MLLYLCWQELARLYKSKLFCYSACALETKVQRSAASGVQFKAHDFYITKVSGSQGTRIMVVFMQRACGCD